MTKRTRAIELRDLALAVVKARGAWQKIGNENSLMFDNGNLCIAYRSPFQKIPQSSGEVARKAMEYGVMIPGNLPHGLDIWLPSGKVLNIEWSDAGEIHLASYKAGPWEQELEELAAAKH